MAPGWSGSLVGRKPAGACARPRVSPASGPRGTTCPRPEGGPLLPINQRRLGKADSGGPSWLWPHGSASSSHWR